ncbi:hypothetical protein J7M22_07865 [Candidatus Poribacteria bacterium]|nr:hypothetical protein [Candidatus Poribacteria bacterium]
MGKSIFILFALLLAGVAWGIDFDMVDSPTAYLDRSGSFALTARVSSDMENFGLSLYSALWRVECRIRFSTDEGKIEPSLNAKALLIRESGVIPALSIGATEETLYVVLGKRFNLPLLGLFSVHLGMDREGPFGGTMKRVDIPSLSSRLKISAERYRDEVSLLFRLSNRWGSEIGFILGMDKDKFKVETISAQIGFSTEELASRIEGTERLAGQAGKLAAEALEKLNR